MVLGLSHESEIEYVEYVCWTLLRGKKKAYDIDYGAFSSIYLKDHITYKRAVLIFV